MSLWGTKLGLSTNNPINSVAQETVSKASPTKKEPNCLRIDTISDTGGQSFYAVIEDFTMAWHIVVESRGLG